MENTKHVWMWDYYLISPTETKLSSNEELEEWLSKNPDVKYDPEVTNILILFIPNHSIL